MNNKVKELKNKAGKSKLMQPFVRNKYCFYSAFAAIGIMLFVYFVFQVIPLRGAAEQSTVLRMDLYHQYGPLFAEFYERITNFDSLIYSWTSGMGSSFLGNFLNYISSPFAIILLILGHERVPEAIAVMMMLYAAFSAGTFTYYIKKTFKRHDLTSAAFGLLYAFCGYFVAYSWNIMWMNAMIILPILVLGIQYIIDGKKPYVYIFALFYAMITNYYMAFMLCIASVVFFLFYYYSKERKGGFNTLFNTGVRFALSSLLAGGLAAVLLVPLYFILQATSATGNTPPAEYGNYFSIYEFIANHLAGVEPTIRSSGGDVFPNIYSGILTLLFLPLYLYVKSISLREKICSVVVLVFFYFSFNVNYLNFAWHGMKFPNDLPYRQSFIYSFIIIVLAYRAFSYLHEISLKQVLTAGIGLVGFVVLVQEIGQKNVSDTIVWASIAFAVVYVVVIAFMKDKKYQLGSIQALLIMAVCTELIVCNTPNYVMNQKKQNFVGDYQDFVAMQEVAKGLEPEGSFYREELTNLRTRMDPSWYYYNGVSVFSSMAYENVSRFQNKLGMFSNAINSHTYNPQTPIYNSMFSLKYLYDKSDRISSEGTFYKYLSQNDSFALYEYERFLPLAFAVNQDMADNFIFNDSEDDPFKLQSEFFEAATGVSDVFSPLDIGIAEDQFVNCDPIYSYNPDLPHLHYTKPQEANSGSFVLLIDVEEDQNVYIYGRSDTIKNITMGSAIKDSYEPLDSDNDLLDGFTEDFYSDFHFGSNNFITERNQSHIFDAGFHEAGSTIALRVNLPEDKTSGSIYLKAMKFNSTAFDRGYNKILQNGTLNIDTFKETYLKGSINVASDMLLYTSIPYDEGWMVTIDGEKVPISEYKAVADAFLALPITKGFHDVSFSYSPKGMKAGAVISVLSIILLLAYYILSKKNYSTKKTQMKLAVAERLEALQEGSSVETAMLMDEDFSQASSKSPPVQSEADTPSSKKVGEPDVFEEFEDNEKEE